MGVKQISVFTESKPGHLARILRLFEDKAVNVRGYSVSDTGEYGIARFIVDNPDLAVSGLKEFGAAYTIKDVICIRLDDEPGRLAYVMDVLSECKVNVTYSYSMISTYIIVGTDDAEAAEAALKNSDVNLINQEDIRRIVAEKFC